MNKGYFAGLLMVSTFAMHAEVKHINFMTEFNAAINSPSLTVVKFGAEWCGPCRSSKPVFERVSKEFSHINFVEVDVDKGSAIADKYGVSGIPLFIYFKGGSELTRHSGSGSSLDVTIKNNISRFGNGAPAAAEKKVKKQKQRLNQSKKKQKKCQ